MHVRSGFGCVNPCPYGETRRFDQGHCRPPAARADRGEVAKLKAKKKFGLVFEEHLPEVVQLPGLAVKPGARVSKRAEKAAVFYIVTEAVNGKKVKIVPEQGGTEEVVAKDAAADAEL